MKQNGLLPALLLSWASLPVMAQNLSDIPGALQLKGLLGTMFSASAPAATSPPPATAVTGKPAVLELVPSSTALGELQADRQCQKVAERFDVFEKAAEYAGVGAQARLTTLIESDFAHSDLTDSDRAMLKYLAYTTIWVPASLEAAVGKALAALADSASSTQKTPTGRAQSQALELVAVRMKEIQAKIDGFPGTVTLLVDPKMAGGAVARVGGIIALSETYLGKMDSDEGEGMRDLVLAHELSHLYKRHSLKELQYQLIGSAEGWKVAKLLIRTLRPATRGFNLSAVTDIFTTGKALADLVSRVQKTQTSYGQEQELEADVCALRWLAPFGVEAGAAWKVLHGMLEEDANANGDAKGAYARLHPSPKERDQNISLALQGGGTAAPRKDSTDKRAKATR